jgi:putative hemolysin
MNEYGNLEGIVTLHDIVESIFGSLPFTPKDAEDQMIQRPDGSWLLDGSLRNDEWIDLLEFANLSEEDRGGYNTLAGFMLHHLGRIPKPADAFIYRHYQFEVMDMDGMRIDKVLVKKSDPIVSQKQSEK